MPGPGLGRIGLLQPVVVAEKPVSPSFLLDEKGQDLILHLSLQSGQELLLPENYQGISPVALLAGNMLYPTRTSEDFPALKMAFEHATMRVRKVGKEAFVRRVLLPLLQLPMRQPGTVSRAATARRSSRCSKVPSSELTQQL